MAFPIETAKKVGKVAVTILVMLTSPIWIFPYMLCALILLIGLGVHQSIWGKRG